MAKPSKTAVTSILASDAVVNTVANLPHSQLETNIDDILAYLLDYTITGTPADNEVFAYNTGTSEWINQTADEANLVDKSTAQTITGAKTFNPKVTITDSASTAPLNITERATAPSSPASGDIYLDDGTNTASTNPGWRRYTGAVWEDVSAGAGGGGGLNNVVEDTTPQLGGELDGQDNTVSKINLKDYGEITNAIGSIGGGTQDIDLTLGNIVTGTVDTSTTTFTFSNPTASDEGCGFTLILTNGGSQTVNWPGSVTWISGSGAAPTLKTSGVDILTFFTVNGGTTWYGYYNDGILKAYEILDYQITHQTLSSSAGTLTMDLNSGNSGVYTFTENVTTVTISNVPASGTYAEFHMKLIQHASAAKTLTWASGFHFPGGTDHVMSTALSAVDAVHGWTIDGGTTWYCTFVQAFA